MQILLKLKSEKPLVIPFNYNYQLQSALYTLLGEVGESDFWHDNGFGDITKYKGFCFGKLEGKYTTDIPNKKIHFENNIYLEVRSSIFDFIDSFQRAIEQHPFIKLYDTKLDVIGASLMNRHFDENIASFDIVSPTVIHDTLENGKTLFYSPDSEDYFIRICNNIIRKYETIYQEEADEVMLRPCGEFKKPLRNIRIYMLRVIPGRLISSLQSECLNSYITQASVKKTPMDLDLLN